MNLSELYPHLFSRLGQPLTPLEEEGYAIAKAAGACEINITGEAYKLAIARGLIVEAEKLAPITQDIEILLKACRLNQSSFAAYLGVSNLTVHRWCAKKTSVPLYARRLLAFYYTTTEAERAEVEQIAQSLG